MKTVSVTLILLAAGNSTRFGADKLCYPVDGMPMLSRSIRFYAGDNLNGMIKHRILVTQPSQKSFIREADSYGYETALNPNPELGISESIRIGLRKANSCNTDGYLFSVADQPFLTERTVLGILDKFSEDPLKIVVPVSGGKSGNPVVFPALFYGELCSLQGDSGGKQVIRKHPESIVTVEAEERELKDIDVESEVNL